MFEHFNQMVFVMFEHWGGISPNVMFGDAEIGATWDWPLQAHDHGGLCCMLLCRVTLGRARKLDSEFHVNKTQLEEVDMEKECSQINK